MTSNKELVHALYAGLIARGDVRAADEASSKPIRWKEIHHFRRLNGRR
jgi:hypothetical protein